MKTKARKRLTLLVGMVLVALAVLGVTLQAASAASGDASGAAASDNTTATAPSQATAQMHAAQIAHNRLDAASTSIGGGSVADTGSSVSSTTIWIVIAVAAGILLVGTWLMMRRRGRRPADAEAFCTLHPHEAGCGTV
jgi:flagellar basal body-associated protein FliL